MDGDCYDYSEMAQRYSGKVVTIADISNTFVDIKEDNRKYVWYPEMFDFFGDTKDVRTVVAKPQDFKNLKPGTKVKIKDNLVIDKIYDGYRYIEQMQRKGLILTINAGNEYNGYNMVEDTNRNKYTCAMIDRIVEEDVKEDKSDGHAILYKVGDRVIIGAKHHGHMFPIGAEVTIKSRGVSYGAYDDEGRNWAFLDDEIQGLASKVNFLTIDLFEGQSRNPLHNDAYSAEVYHKGLEMVSDAIPQSWQSQLRTLVADAITVEKPMHLAAATLLRII